MSVSHITNRLPTPQQLALAMKWVPYGGGKDDSDDEEKGWRAADKETGPISVKLLSELADQNKSSIPQNALNATDTMTGGSVLESSSPNTDDYRSGDGKLDDRAALSPENRHDLTQAGLKAEIGKAAKGAMGAGASLAGIAAQKTGDILKGELIGSHQRPAARPDRNDKEEQDTDSEKTEGSADSWEDWAEDFFRRGSDWFDTKGSVVAGWTQGLANALDSWTAARMFKKAQKLGGRQYGDIGDVVEQKMRKYGLDKLVER